VVEDEKTGHVEDDDDGRLLPSEDRRHELARLEGQLDALSEDIARARRDLERATTSHFEDFLGPRSRPRRVSAPPTGEPLQLRDGSTVMARPLEPADTSLVEEGFEHLSAVNRYRQFIFDRPDLNEVTTIDDDHWTIGAVDPTTGAGVGLARYVRDPRDSTRATAAVVVVDDWQGRGLATRLLGELVTRARSSGIQRFEAHMIIGDVSSQRMFESVGTVETVERAAGVVDVTVRL
jgi:GNAT superfamily N-acetyltransferase